MYRISPINNHAEWYLEKKSDPTGVDRLLLRMQGVVLSEIICSSSPHRATLHNVLVRTDSTDLQPMQVRVEGYTRQQLHSKMAIEKAVAQNLKAPLSLPEFQQLFSQQVHTLSKQIQEMSNASNHLFTVQGDSHNLYEIFAQKDRGGNVTVGSLRQHYLDKITKDPYCELPPDLEGDAPFVIEAIYASLAFIQRLDEYQIARILGYDPTIVQNPKIADKLMKHYRSSPVVLQALFQATEDVSLLKSILSIHSHLLKNTTYANKVQEFAETDIALKMLLRITSSKDFDAIGKAIVDLVHIPTKEIEYVLLAILQRQPAVLDLFQSTYFRMHHASFAFSKNFIVKALSKNPKVGEGLISQILQLVTEDTLKSQEKKTLFRYLASYLYKKPYEIGRFPASLCSNYSFIKRVIKTNPQIIERLSEESLLLLLRQKPALITTAWNWKTLAMRCSPDFMIRALQTNPEVFLHLPATYPKEVIEASGILPWVYSQLEDKILAKNLCIAMAASMEDVKAIPLSTKEKEIYAEILKKIVSDRHLITSSDLDCYVDLVTVQNRVLGNLPLVKNMQGEAATETGFAKDNRPKDDNEDRFFYKEWPSGAVFGVFDGHGGGDVAEYLKRYCEKFFTATLEQHKGHVPSTLKTLFASVQDLVRDEVPSSLKQGSTAQVSFWDKIHSVWYTATLGDTEACVYLAEGQSLPLCFSGGWDNEEDHKRAHKYGGVIHESRAISREGEPIFRVHKGGRSLEPAGGFGDGMFGHIIRRVPVITAVYVTPGDVVIIRSDGVGMLHEKAIISIIQKARLAQTSIAKSLCIEARKISLDDLTALVIEFA